MPSFLNRALRACARASAPAMLGTAMLRAAMLGAAMLGAAPLAAFAAAPVHPPLDPRNTVIASLNQPADITAAFLVRAGDDPSFASPTLDDSSWQRLDSARSLSSIGIRDFDVVWYRTHLHIPPHSTHLSLLLRGFIGSQQIFVNGVLTGPNRSLAGGGGANPNFDVTAPIPDALLDSGDLVLAIRGYIHNGRHSLAGQPGFSGRSLLVIGDSAVLEDRVSLETFYEYTSNITDTAFTVVVLAITLALWFALRQEHEYLWLAVYLAGAAYSEIVSILQTRYDLRLSAAAYVLVALVNIVSLLGGLEFARIVLRQPRRRWIVTYEAVIVGLLVVSTAINLYTFRSGAPPLPVLWGMLLLYALSAGSLGLGLPVFALYQWRRTRNFDALLLSVPILARGLFFYLYLGYDVYSIFHYGAVHPLPNPPLGSFGVSWIEVCDFVFLLALLLFLILRTVRLARARAALAAEVAAAQSVQQLLLARASHPTPGFLVDAVYHPASAVGGDFFLISPSPAPPTLDPSIPSLIAVVGDVSGKGLGAAMRVSLILGALARESSRQPAEILAGLNQTLIAQAGDPAQLGFTTASCLRLFANGDYTIANAGHLSPWLCRPALPGARPSATATAEEISTPPALPLGLEPHQSYEVVHGRLAPGERLVFLSDGIPEARNHHGALLGFDRLPGLILGSPAEIADAARSFGQEDDITVLSVSLA